MVVDRPVSTRFIAALPEAEGAGVVAAVRRLIANTSQLASRETVSFPYETMTFRYVKT